MNDQDFTKPDPIVLYQNLNGPFHCPVIKVHKNNNFIYLVYFTKSAFIFSVSDPNRWLKKAIKTELEERNIDYDDKENKSELVTKLRKDIVEETQRELKGMYLMLILFSYSIY